VPRGAGLLDAKDFHNVADAALATLEEKEHPQSGAVGEGTEHQVYAQEARKRVKHGNVLFICFG